MNPLPTMWENRNYELFEPTGLSIELNNVVYVADYRLFCVKIPLSMHHVAEFLSELVIQ